MHVVTGMIVGDLFDKPKNMGDYRFGPKFVTHFLNQITFLPLPFVQVILVPYCCLFCVVPNNMMNGAIGTFS